MAVHDPEPSPTALQSGDRNRNNRSYAPCKTALQIYNPAIEAGLKKATSQER